MLFYGRYDRRVSFFVVLALVLAVLATAVMVVTVRELLRNLRKLSAAARATNERLMPLSQELQSELAVTSLEVEGLSAQLTRLQTERQARAQQRQVRNLGRKGERSRKRSRRKG